MRLVVIDIGGTDIKYSVMDETLVCRKQGSIPTPQERQEDLFEAIRSIYEPHRDETEGIAVSMPGFIDSEKGRCNGGGALAYNRDTSIAPQLSALCGCPVHIANDGKCAAYAEYACGALKGTENCGVYIIGTGVGGGIIIDGKIVNGKHFTAGEYSFLRCNLSPWNDGRNIVGNVCSTTGLLNAYRTRAGLSKEEPLNGRIFFDHVQKGEAQAREVLDTFAVNVAKSIANISILLDLEKVAIGGGISRQPVLIQKIDAAMDPLFSVPGDAAISALTRPQIVPCRFSSDANMVGAYLYYRDSIIGQN